MNVRILCEVAFIHCLLLYILPMPMRNNVFCFPIIEMIGLWDNFNFAECRPLLAHFLYCTLTYFSRYLIIDRFLYHSMKSVIFSGHCLLRKWKFSEMKKRCHRKWISFYRAWFCLDNARNCVDIRIQFPNCKALVLLNLNTGWNPEELFSFRKLLLATYKIEFNSIFLIFL